MNGYTKLFSSILASTIWRADDKTRIVWITMLAMADRNGVAEGSIPGLADFARVSVEDCRRALTELEAPDLDSRSHEYDGRRIVTVDGGWLLLNHGKYRQKMNVDERREYLRLKAREYRKKAKSVDTAYTGVDKRIQPSTLVTQAEAEAVRTSVLKNSTDVTAPKKSEPDPQVKEFLEWFPIEYAKRRNDASYFVVWPKHSAIVKRLLKLHALARLKDHAIILLTTDEEWTEGTDRGIEVLAAKINWFEDRLAAWEKRHGSRQARS